MLLQVIAHVILALADPFTVIAVPGTSFVDNFLCNTEVDDFALARDALTIEDVKFGLPERRRHLVFDHLGARFVADDLVTFLDRADASDVDPHRRIELERIAASRRLRVSEHDADLHSNLVDENHQGIGPLDVRRQFTQRLRHQSCLQAHLRLTHLAFDLGFGRQCCHRIDDDDVYRARTHQHVSYLERLLTVVRLRDQQFVNVDPEPGGILGIQCVLRVNKGRCSADLLHFSDN